MKAWLTKLRISAALDAEQQPSTWLRKRLSRPDELSSVEQEMMALDRGLRQTAPRVQAPASLHCAIMQAVRAADRPVTARRVSSLLRWLPAPAFGLVALLAVLWALHSPIRQPAQSAQSLGAATTALQMGDQMVRAVPSAVVAPLSDELERLTLDLDKTAQFLLASVP